MAQLYQIINNLKIKSVDIKMPTMYENSSCQDINLCKNETRRVIRHYEHIGLRSWYTFLYIYNKLVLIVNDFSFTGVKFI